MVQEFTIMFRPLAGLVGAFASVIRYILGLVGIFMQSTGDYVL